MTIEQLRQVVEDVKANTDLLWGKSNELRVFMERVSNTISAESPFSSTIDIDQFVAIQTPIFLGLLSEIEQITDQLGSDN